MRDMSPRNDRSIRNIPVPANHRRVPQPAPQNEYEDEEAPPPRRKIRTRRGWFMWGAVGVVLLCAIAGILLSTLFAGATVVVYPKTASVTVPPTVSAALNPSSGALGYSSVSTSRTASVTVPTNGTQQVSTPASGVITVYNNYSTATQKLIANTRFEAPNGKIYRIHDSVTVPGETKNADGTMSPGTATVTAFADSPGADYNFTSSTKFTVPGFQGDPRYDKFYAQAPQMTGGFVGAQAAIAPNDLTTAQNSLKQALTSAINDASTSQIPKDFVLVQNSLSVVFNGITQAAPSGGSVQLSQTAAASIDIIRATDLAAAIARQSVQGYNGEPVAMADASKVSLSLATSSGTTGIIQINLSGSPTLVWQFDQTALAKALLGKDKAAFETVVQSFTPAITCTKDTPCSASIRPFWTNTFPKDIGKIKVVIGQ